MELYLKPKIAIQKERHDKNGCFKKGAIPWNKGLKGLDIGGKETQFKEGHLPYNTKHDLAISKRYHKKDNKYYYYVRVSKGVWQLLNRYNYQQIYGEIPKGYIVIFKDGNHLNCDPVNLEMISRAENLKRNENRIKGAKSLKTTWDNEHRRNAYGLEQETKFKCK